MNADQLKGKWTQFKGELKQKWGKFTDDDLQQIEGNYDKFIGKVQERYGDEKERADEVGGRVASEVGSESRGEEIVLLQEGRALEDWVKAECQLVGAAGKKSHEPLVKWKSMSITRGDKAVNTNTLRLRGGSMLKHIRDEWPSDGALLKRRSLMRRIN